MATAMATASPAHSDAEALEQMIEQQIRAWDVLDAQVLELFRSVPRERFVPPEHRHLAYADMEVPLPCGQHMLRPNVTGRILQALELGRAASALEIGTGSGFLSACLRRAVGRVRSFEIHPQLAALATRNLAAFGMGDVEVVSADALQAGGAERYDVIAVTASMPVYDPRFERQLAIGGRLFVAVGPAPAMEARRVRRTGEESWVTESLFETVIAPLVNAAQPPAFTF